MVKNSKVNILFCAFVLFGCQTSPTLRFEAQNRNAENIKASLVNFGDITESGKDLGTLPVDIEVSELAGSSVRLTAPGFETQHWVIAEQLGETNTVRVNLDKSIEEATELPRLQTSASLLLLRSYKALSESNYELAIQLAKESESVLRLGPATSIVEALALLQSGQKQQAQVTVEKALALYPEVDDLKQLSAAIQAQ